MVTKAEIVDDAFLTTMNWRANDESGAVFQGTGDGLRSVFEQHGCTRRLHRQRGRCPDRESRYGYVVPYHPGKLRGEQGAVRHSSVIVFLALSMLPVSFARAEIAVMESGKILYVDRYHRADELITLFLTGGGEVTVASEVVVNIVPNEIVEETETAVEQLPLLPQLDDLIAPVAKRHGLDPRLVAAVIMVESSGDPKAESRKGARGLMQLMPETAKTLGVRNSFDPEQNVDGGSRYLRSLLDQHEEDLSLALAAYNAGPTAVAKHGGIPPYPETQKYVKRVLELYGEGGSS